MGEEDQAKSSSPSSDRCQWRRILRAMVEMVHSQQSQIEGLAGDRKFLEDYVHLQHDRWVSKVRLLESHLSQVKKEEVKRNRVELAWADLLVGMKKSEVLCYKEQLELTESDLHDFCECVEALNSEVSELKKKVEENKKSESNQERGEDAGLKTAENAKEGNQCSPQLEGEIRRLKHAYRKLSSKKEAEVSALLAEKDFVWNQFKKMENDYIAILKTKRIEIDQANEAVEKLQHNLEKLQSSVNEKDEIITQLKTEKSRLELNIRQQKENAGHDKQQIGDLEDMIEELRSSLKEKDEVIHGLRSNLGKIGMDLKRCSTENSSLTTGLHRNSRGASVTPVLSRPRKASGKRVQESRSNRVNQKSRLAYGESSGSQASDVVSQPRRCSSRRERSSTSTLEAPRLFSSTFKVPKVKDTFTAVG